MTKVIKMSDLKREPRRPKTKAWDPSKVISTGNIERVREANKKAAGQKGKGGKKSEETKD